MGILKKKDLTSHDVFEFMQGRLSGTHWLEDSIYLTEETIAETQLVDYLTLTLRDFNYYGPTEVTQEEWNQIMQNVNASNSEIAKQLVNEIDEWAKNCFKSHSCFTICGI
ncbi:hypothetical protein FRY98_12750 [Paenibacillus faecis]|uniref:Uncharacterized protein n=1 Tax=Paenibacillus faecis TaxID=862114 RepID=A0A5D0CUC4_9BACL|nr:hypothetical protein [Paenibacillus faecis]TYA13513.1 hypothetical protein FRY98_12750 [Paenibacillus faecis]